jgi:hypothetical protein
VNKAPVTLLLNEILVVAALQIVVGPTAVTLGIGLTVTTTFTGMPEHELAVGVTIYVTVPAEIPGLIRTWAIVEPDDEAAPVIPPVTDPIVQLKVAPVILLARAILVVVAVHIVVLPVAVTSGVGLTVILKVCTGPSQVNELFAK